MPPRGRAEAPHPLVDHLVRPEVTGATAGRELGVTPLSQQRGIVQAMTETEDVMTQTGEADGRVIDEAIIDEALRLIDGGLADLLHRELVSTDEISDLLLDVRMLLTATDMAAGVAPLIEQPVGA